MLSSRLPVGVFLLSVAGLTGCGHMPPSGEVGVRPRVFSTGLQAEDLRTQSLFRAHYQSGDGSGAFRLVLQLETAERYRIETKDRFGRGLWRIEADPSGTVWVDDRRKLFCAGEGVIRIPEIALESLPLEELPAILLGRLPGDLESVAGDGEYRDRSGRRWTVSATLTARGGEPTAWTLWEAGEPWLWWRGESAGEGVLSHRAGTQLRWKRVAVEPMEGKIARLVLAPEYESVACEAWPGALEAAESRIESN